MAQTSDNKPREIKPSVNTKKIVQITHPYMNAKDNVEINRL